MAFVDSKEIQNNLFLNSYKWNGPTDNLTDNKQTN